MTLFDVEELTRYWIDHPPLHLTIAAYLGVGKEQREGATRPVPTRSSPNANIGQLLAELGPSFASGEVHAGLRPVVLDFAELRRRSTTSV